MKYRVHWRDINSYGHGDRTYPKGEAEKLCALLNKHNEGISEHWIEPVEKEFGDIVVVLALEIKEYQELTTLLAILVSLPGGAEQYVYDTVDMTLLEDAIGAGKKYLLVCNCGEHIYSNVKTIACHVCRGTDFGIHLNEEQKEQP